MNIADSIFIQFVLSDINGFNASMHHEGRFRLPLSDHQFIVAVFTDYACVLDEFEKTKRKLDKENKRVFKVKDVRMRKVLGLPDKEQKEIIGSRRNRIQRAIDTQNISFHAVYNDDECLKFINLCENVENAAFMKSEGLTVDVARELVKDLKYFRELFIATYEFED